LAFYGVYHRDPINQVIHFFGVPAIIWGIFVFFSHLDIPLGISKSLPMIHIPRVGPHKATYATLTFIIYTVFYLYLDPFGGVLYFPFSYLMYTSGTSYTLEDRKEAAQTLKKKDDDANAKSSSSSSSMSSVPWTGTGKALKLGAFVHFLGWYVQIHPGHGHFEGATPAATKSLGGALSSAPLFAFYEGLWFVGLNKELQDRTKELVDIYTIELCKSGEHLRACADYDLN